MNLAQVAVASFDWRRGALEFSHHRGCSGLPLGELLTRQSRGDRVAYQRRLSVLSSDLVSSLEGWGFSANPLLVPVVGRQQVLLHPIASGSVTVANAQALLYPLPPEVNHGCQVVPLRVCKSLCVNSQLALVL